MEIRAHTEQTLRHSRIGLLVMSIGLSAALIAPPAYSGPITTAMALASFLGFSALRARMPRQVADFSLVSKAERRGFLVKNTAWLIAGLVAYGIVFTLIFTGLPFPVRAGLGHVALAIGAISLFMVGKTAMAHSKRVATAELQASAT